MKTLKVEINVFSNPVEVYLANLVFKLAKEARYDTIILQADGNEDSFDEYPIDEIIENAEKWQKDIENVTPEVFGEDERLAF